MVKPRTIYKGKLSEFLRVWEVTEIVDYDVDVSSIWARDHKYLLFYRRTDGSIRAMAEDGFSWNSYEQFTFEFTGNDEDPDSEGYIISRNIQPGVHLKAGFQEEADHSRIFVSFKGRGGDNHHTEGPGGWGGGAGDP